MVFLSAHPDPGLFPAHGSRCGVYEYPEKKPATLESAGKS